MVVVGLSGFLWSASRLFSVFRGCLSARKTAGARVAIGEAKELGERGAVSDSLSWLSRRAHAVTGGHQWTLTSQRTLWCPDRVSTKKVYSSYLNRHLLHNFFWAYWWRQCPVMINKYRYWLSPAGAEVGEGEMLSRPLSAAAQATVCSSFRAGVLCEVQEAEPACHTSLTHFSKTLSPTEPP